MGIVEVDFEDLVALLLQRPKQYIIVEVEKPAQCVAKTLEDPGCGERTPLPAPKESWVKY